jgi:hypothetical protein
MLYCEIHVGQQLIWEAEDATARVAVKVAAVEGGRVLLEAADGSRHWNDTSRVKEACSLVDWSPGLEGCPFCNSCPALTHEKLGVLWFVFCVSCGGRGPERHAKKDAVDNWNRRSKTMRPGNDLSEYRAWRLNLLEMFNATKRDRPDEEEVAIRFDNGLTEQEAFNSIVAERESQRLELPCFFCNGNPCICERE